MLHDKQYYRDLNLPNGYKWGGESDLPYTHFFVRGDYKHGFSEIECSETCIANGDIQFLAENHMTCDKARLKKLSRECVKKYG